MKDYIKYIIEMVHDVQCNDVNNLN